MNEFGDVKELHRKFNFLHGRDYDLGGKPQKLTRSKLWERVQCMQEELDEFKEACGFPIERFDYQGVPFVPEPGVKLPTQDFPGQADALVDLVYFALGTAVMMNLPWETLWNDVHRANMTKERGVSHRGHKVDLRKPDGWEGPHTGLILEGGGYRSTDPEVDDESDQSEA